MDSFDKSCNVAKHNYDECFQKWFNRFLKNRDTNLNVCDAEFREYQQCLKKAMKEEKLDFKEFEEDILGTEKEYKPPPPK
ncbi:unnamed protein product [Bemisia tabaci]|uniref:Uncharacterized protein n=1 Tax=Bemisia tabaci TaxID=7038 RepID=A0A9P0A0Q4_BEMTA|nr:PREDICTED: uncharacterized protein C119.18-like isoform X1 [Bemisia tabaci]CAH0381569.1 unnamed protein product [Bemisia tabaci]